MGQTTQIATKKCVAKSCFLLFFFAAVLTGKDESNVNTWEVQVFVEIIMRYVIKSTDKVLSLRKVYCAIDIS